MNIKEAKQLTGISEQMIRFYEKKKIIKPSRNEENGYRLYTNHEIFLMVMSRSYNSLGIPLDNVLDYIHPKNLKEVNDNLDETINNLIEQEKWLKQKMRYAKDLSSIFNDLQNNKSYSIVHFDKLYFYPNSTDKDSKYHDIFKHIGVSRAVLRVDKNILNQDEFPNDIGVLLTTDIKESEVLPIVYKDITLIRFYKETPVSEVIPPNGIHNLLKQVHKLGYSNTGDTFIYQIAEKDSDNPTDLICVEFIVK